MFLEIFGTFWEETVGTFDWRLSEKSICINSRKFSTNLGDIPSVQNPKIDFPTSEHSP